MALLLKYLQATGAIVGIWDSPNLAVLQTQRVEETPEHGYLLCLEPLEASTVAQDYVVWEGAVVRRSRPQEDR